VNAVLRGMLDEVLTVHTGASVELSGTQDGVLMRAAAIGVEVEVDRVLVAVGRTPNVDDMGLECLGLPLDKRGLSPFNPETTQVGDLPVFIAGDANAYATLLHEAADEGYIAGYNAVADDVICFQRRTPLGIVFTDPAVALVGQRHAELNMAQTLIGEVCFDNQGRARIAERNQGLLRLYAERGGGRLLGAEMCGPATEHMAHLLALAIGQRLTVRDLLRMPFYHPVLEEGLRSALRDLARQLGKGGPDLAACNAYRTEALD
jgi:dihydrolipoamide dehydrogenase